MSWGDMNLCFFIWRDPNQILRNCHEIECEETWKQWISLENWDNAMVDSGNVIAIELHYAIFGEEKSSSCIDIEQLTKMKKRILSIDWIMKNEISRETHYQIIMIFGKIEEAIERDGYVVYQSEVMRERDIVEDFKTYFEIKVR